MCKSLNSSNVFNFRTCYNSTYAALNNLRDIASYERVQAAEEYFNIYMLGKSKKLEDYGSIRWPLMGTLFTAWVVVALSLLKGIKTSGKVVYFTATFPYVILVILFIRGITLEGALDGIHVYLYPEIRPLAGIQVWQDAAVQVFYSLNIAGGGVITYASYNKFHNNLIKDVLIITIGNTLTSFFCGLVVFSMLGFLAMQTQKSVSDVVDAGPSLAFIAFPDAIARIDMAPLWALLFFFMLFLLGIQNQFAAVETIITFVFDHFPNTRNRKPIVVCITAAILFLLGLTLTTNGGIYLLEVMDTYAVSFPFMIIGLMELLVVAYIYGMDNFTDDLSKMMIELKPSKCIQRVLIAMKYVTPIIVVGMLVMAGINYYPVIDSDDVFSMSANSIGWTMTSVLISVIPLLAMYQLCKKHTDLPLLKRLRTLTSPTDEWRANASRLTGERNEIPLIQL